MKKFNVKLLVGLALVCLASTLFAQTTKKISDLYRIVTLSPTDLVLITTTNITVSSPSGSNYVIAVGDLRTYVTGGPLIVSSPSSIYGGGGARIGINTNQGPAMDDYSSTFRFFGDDNGYQWYSKDGSTVPMSLTPDGPLLVTVGKHNSADTYGYGREPTGANVSTYPIVNGGSASGLRDLPPHGPEIWRNNPFPLVMVTTWADQVLLPTSAYLTNAVRQYNANGLVASMAKYGAKPWMEIDAGWFNANRDAHNLLQPDATRFPEGIKWLADYVHTNGSRLMIQQSYNSFFVNTAIQQNPSNFDPVSTPVTINSDVLTFYNWAVDGVRIGDSSAAVGGISEAYNTSGYMLQNARQWADSALNPNGFPWQLNYSNCLVLDWFGANNIPNQAPLEVNGYASDFGDPLPGVVIGVVSQPVSLARNTWTNMAWASGKGHYFGYGYVQDAGRNNPTNLWRTALAMVSLWGNDIQLVTNPPLHEIESLTNDNFLSVYLDAEQNPAWLANDNGTNSLWVKRLANGGYAAIFVNEGTNAANNTLYWTNLTVPPSFVPIQTMSRAPVDTNASFECIDVWGKSSLGFYSQSLTVSVPGTNVVMVKMLPATTVWMNTESVANDTGGAAFTRINGTSDGFFFQSGMRKAGSGQARMAIPLPPFVTSAAMEMQVHLTPSTYVSAMTNTYTVRMADTTTAHYYDTNAVENQQSSGAFLCGTGTTLLKTQWALPAGGNGKWLEFLFNTCTNTGSDREIASPIKVMYR